MEIGLYSRKPLTVQAIKIDADNMEAVAIWCGGKVLAHPPKKAGQEPKKFIRVDVLNPLSKKQTRAYVGDWILKSNQGFKIWSNSAFMKGFTHIFTPEKEN